MPAKRYNTASALAEATPSASEIAIPDTKAIKLRESAFDQVVSEVHRTVMRTAPHHMAQTLRDALSTQLLAYMTRQSERTIQRWARGDIQSIRQDSRRRLITAYEILQIINHFENPKVAQTWFIGSEPQLDFTMPARAIRDDQLEEALAAARTFVAVG